MALQKTNTKNDIHRAMFVIYGPSGVGKTRLVTTLPEEKTLILSTENGLIGLHEKNYDVFVIRSWQDLFDACKELSKPESLGKYEYIFVDSFTKIIEMNHHAIISKADPSSVANLNTQATMRIQDWNTYGTMVKNFLAHFRNLTYHVIFTCLEDREKDELTDRVKYYPAIPGKMVPNALLATADFYFRMVHVRPTQDDHVTRKLLTAGSIDYDAKDRSGKLKPAMDPDLSEIFRIIFEKKEKKNGNI